jgi:protein TonB
MEQAVYTVSRQALVTALALSTLLHGVALLYPSPLSVPLKGDASSERTLQIRVLPSVAPAENKQEEAPAAPELLAASPPAPAVELKTPVAVPSPVRREPVRRVDSTPPHKAQAVRPQTTVKQPTSTAVGNHPPATTEVRSPQEATAEQTPLLRSVPRYNADYLHNPAPTYPALARRLHLEGRVVLRVRVGTQGAALETRVDSSSGYDILDQAALAAVREWRFVPARQGGAAIEAWVQVPVAFRLTDR